LILVGDLTLEQLLILFQPSQTILNALSPRRRWSNWRLGGSLCRAGSRWWRRSNRVQPGSGGLEFTSQLQSLRPVALCFLFDGLDRAFELLNLRLQLPDRIVQRRLRSSVRCLFLSPALSGGHTKHQKTDDIQELLSERIFEAHG